MLELKNIDLDALVQALDFNFMDDETFFWLDPATGQIDLWGEEAADEAEAEGWDLDDRGAIRIDPCESHEGYRDMENYITTVQDRNIQESLIRSINRSKPFRHFQDTLHRYPDQTERWFAFHDQAMLVRAVEWLQENHLIADNEAEAELAKLGSPAPLES